MPELPEVETTVRELIKKLRGLGFWNVRTKRKKPLQQAGGLAKFKKEIKGHKILKVWRRAKFIVVDIEGPKSLFIHQKISGHLLYGKLKLIKGVWQSIAKGPIRDDPKNKYLRIVFTLSNGYHLALSDLRRFGRVLLVDDKNINEIKAVSKLGPEPLDILYKEFRDLFRKKKGRIKPVLMDPFFIVGIGNIYADEILWESGLHPLSRVENLEDKDIKKIYKFTRTVLAKAIRYKGSSMDDYRVPSGEKGEFQNHQKAYQRTGRACLKKDGGVMERLVIGARSAHFCPIHQIRK